MSKWTGLWEPRYILQKVFDGELDAVEARVLSIIHNYTKREGHCDFSLPEYAKLCGVKRSAVASKIKRLTDLNLVTTLQNSGSNSLRIAVLLEDKNGDVLAYDNQSKIWTGPVQNLDGSISPTGILRKNNRRNGVSPIGRSSKKQTSVQPQFGQRPDDGLGHVRSIAVPVCEKMAEVFGSTRTVKGVSTVIVQLMGQHGEDMVRSVLQWWVDHPNVKVLPHITSKTALKTKWGRLQKVFDATNEDADPFPDIAEDFTFDRGTFGFDVCRHVGADVFPDVTDADYRFCFRLIKHITDQINKHEDPQKVAKQITSFIQWVRRQCGESEFRTTSARLSHKVVEKFQTKAA